MMNDNSTSGKVYGLYRLVDQLERQQGFDDVLASLSKGDEATLDGVWGSSCALVAATLKKHAPETLVVICSTTDQQDDLVADLPLFTEVNCIERFPALEATPDERVVYDELFGERLRMLKRLDSVGNKNSVSQNAAITPKLLVTNIQALLQPVPSRAELKAQTKRMKVGQETSIHDLAEWLVINGFHNTTAVELPGEFSVRGGIVDIFAPDWFDPVRIEFFGDEVDSIRRFEVSSQRSLSTIDEIEVTILEPKTSDNAYLSEYLTGGAWVMIIEPGDIEHHGQHYLQRVDNTENFFSVSDVLRRLVKFPSVTASAMASGTFGTTCNLQIESVERFTGDINRVRDELDEAGANQNAFVVCQTKAEVERLAEIFAKTKLAKRGKLHFTVGSLSVGFRLVAERIVLISSGELFRRSDVRRTARRHLGKVIDSFIELNEGDLVVHVAHGIGRYRGLKLLEKDQQAEEHLVLEFAGGTRLYVPTSKIGLVQKYVGSTKGRATLAKIGGQTWARQKERVRNAILDLAAEMLELQAVRASRPGISFTVDTQWQKEFDASFPYVETADQLVAIEEIRDDMRRSRPMDRLLCGDVGYGKTELAMRATFKAVDAGYQVAVLVPTTILAEQHHRTFTERMAEFPFEIASLSRFSTKKKQKETIEKLMQGSIDIVIGTHRLAQSDINFHNLGMVIIDEEQRFGVDIKERLKMLRKTVDVLTMTATPIPRTLHMGLLGLRDISNLETPPEDRLAVETRVTRFNPTMIRHAIMRELGRGGQIFFVHNRVNDIQRLADRLGQIVPEASIRIGHGQMPESQLEKVMLDFVGGKFDILVATTIVESGLDIPNANTIFIDEADRYGLADLHQLRGRVGRYKHRAYCYLLVDQKKSLTPTATRRLRAIEEFSNMGAGFAISMRDLEIRGAGNILGTEQSGHIAVVGYELYCTLLEQATRALKRLPPKTSIDVEVDLPIEAYLPRSYVSDMRLKVDLYRRFARVSNLQELGDFTTELSDRFGTPTEVVARLLLLAEVRIAAHHWQIATIHKEDNYVVFGYISPKKIDALVKLSRQRLAGGPKKWLRVVDGRSAYLPLPKGLTQSGKLLEVLKSLLQQPK